MQQGEGSRTGAPNQRESWFARLGLKSGPIEERLDEDIERMVVHCSERGIAIPEDAVTDYAAWHKPMDGEPRPAAPPPTGAVSYTHLRAHET